MATNISTIIINASIQRVWDMITLPRLVKLWQYGSDLKTSWEIGTEINFRTEFGEKVFEQWGRVLAFEPNTLIRYSLFAPRPGLEDRPENYFIMSYKLTPVNGMVRLEIIQEDSRPDAVQEKPQGEENPVLKALKDLAESVQ